MSQTIPRLGSISINCFMRDYWQRKPLLVRGALPGFRPPVGRNELFALAARDDVESRLIVRTGSRWSLQHGPLPRRMLPPVNRSRWTLLVQGLDLLDAGARELLSRFRFVPDARMDDLMASYATHGGGVGPHVDNYDVFLLQAHGRRRWRISPQRNLRLQPGRPLQLLAGFRPSEEWLLEPGDLLYLPPGVPHDGIAEGECITYSVGFRAPTWQELLDPWFASFAERQHLPGRYSDPAQRPVSRPAQLPGALVDRVHATLARARPRRADTERFLLEHLSEPKPGVVFDRPARRLPYGGFGAAARRRGLVLDLRTRMLVGRSGVAVNGELFPATGRLRRCLADLANGRQLAARDLVNSPAGLIALLHDWHSAGWLHVRPWVKSRRAVPDTCRRGPCTTSRRAHRTRRK